MDIVQLRAAKSYLNTAITHVRRNVRLFGERFPNYGEGRQYVLKENNNWVAGFWPGMVWLAYRRTGDPDLSAYAASLLPHL